MIAFRISKENWINDLSGTGAKLSGGRWNPKGIPVLYCASTSSLAILETLVHIDIDLLPNDLYIAEIEIPENQILELSPQDLPRNWNNNPSPDSLKNLGRGWIMENKFLTLKVPSAVNPNESNYIINVGHPDFDKVLMTKTYPIFLDDRLRR